MKFCTTCCIGQVLVCYHHLLSSDRAVAMATAAAAAAVLGHKDVPLFNGNFCKCRPV